MYVASNCKSPVKFASWPVLFWAAVVWGAFSSAARAQEPLYLQEPYDQITLDAANENLVLKVELLDFPNREVPEKLRGLEPLTVRLLDKPGESYLVQWASIEKIELFERLVLDEANRLVKDQQLDEAFDYFGFLLDNYPKLPGLTLGIEGYLYQEAHTLYKNGQHEVALSVLHDLHERNPELVGLEAALGSITEKVVEAHVASGDYLPARHLLRNLAQLFPEHATVAQWESKFKAQAAELLKEARQAVDQNELAKAHALGSRLKSIWPALPGIEEFLRELHTRYTRVTVAVTTTIPDDKSGGLDDWASRRAHRLLHRTIMEFTGPSTEGGHYVCPLGQMEIQDLGLHLAFRLQPDLQWSQGEATLTGYDLAQQLLAIADPGEPAYRVEWAELLAGVSVDAVYSVEVDLRRPHVCPGALLQTIVVPHGPAAPKQSNPTNGPYLIDSQTPDESLFVTNPRYFVAGSTQPNEIVERYFDEGAKAIWELKHQRVDLIDRVNPWDLDKVLQMEELVVEPYAMPLVHTIVPNMRNPLLARRTFRRALTYGINREAILERLLGETTRDGCQVISGPFSPGVTHDDPLGYAYDRRIAPRKYNPQLAIALAQIAVSELIAAQKKQKEEQEPGEEGEQKEEGEPEKDALQPELVLGYPPHEIARRAAAEIRRQLELIGITITLRELPYGIGSRIPDEIDLLYAELAVWEPVVDARRLLDHDGVTGGASPYMTQALWQLEQAPDWIQAGSKLRQIHRLAHQEIALIPLWQMTDHFAYHRSLQGVGSRPVSLYQNVEQWQPTFHNSAEEP